MVKEILETVLVRDKGNLRAHILVDEILLESQVVNQFMNRTETYEHINEFKSGYVQTSLTNRMYKSKKQESGAHDYLIHYDEIFSEIEEYAKKKYGDKFQNTQTVTSYTFPWNTKDMSLPS